MFTNMNALSKPFWYLVLLALSSFILCASSKSATIADPIIEKKIQSKDFVIVVTHANPLRGKQRFLTSSYDLKIRNDSAFAYLPYFGVAHSPRIGLQDSGIKFAQLMRNYTNVPTKKKNGWNIRFDVKDNGYSYRVNLTVFDNGNSSINVQSIDRDAITFYGNVER